MPIAKFISTTDIMDIHNEINPENKISYKMALRIRKMCRQKYEEEFGKVELYDDNLIPLSWYERYFGEDAFDPKRRKATRKSNMQENKDVENSISA